MTTEVTEESIRNELLAQESRLALLSFDADTAWDLGSTLHSLAVNQHPGKPVYISITHMSSGLMFLARTKGVLPSRISGLDGIRNAVKCLEMSTWRASHPCGGITSPMVGDCDLTLGGWPIKVKGVEGVVAVLVVDGLGLKLGTNGFPEIIWVRHSQSSSGQVNKASLDHELILSALEVVLSKQQNAVVS